MKFKDYINAVMQEKGFNKRDLTRLFAISIPTVERWMNGINEPHPIMQKAIKEVLGGVKAEGPMCNLCGLTCVLGHEGHPSHGPHGLINQAVSGGYESTPGNGYGALDDTTRYRFSLCEFCLDWLFSQFQIPVSVEDYMAPGEKIEPWAPAQERVVRDDWRKMKAEFQSEHDRREVARKGTK